MAWRRQYTVWGGGYGKPTRGPAQSEIEKTLVLVEAMRNRQPHQRCTDHPAGIWTGDQKGFPVADHIATPVIAGEVLEQVGTRK